MSNQTILIIDDDRSLRSLIKDTLEEEGYHSLEANNGISALKVLAESKVDLIILDLMMPRMDGYMFLEHLGKKQEKDSLKRKMPPVIVLTVVDRIDDFGLAKNLGANAFLTKPFKANDLFEMVQKLLR